MKVVLRCLSLYDTDKILRWRNDESVKKNLFSQDILTKTQHEEYYKRNVETGNVKQFIISADGIDCGTVFLKNIDLNNKKAELGIFIGESSFRGKGVGTAATTLALEYAFSILHLKCIYLKVLKDNEPAIKSYVKNGFVKKGIHYEMNENKTIEYVLMEKTNG